MFTADPSTRRLSSTQSRPAHSSVLLVTEPLGASAAPGRWASPYVDVLVKSQARPATLPNGSSFGISRRRRPGAVLWPGLGKRYSTPAKPLLGFRSTPRPREDCRSASAEDHVHREAEFYRLTAVENVLRPR